MRVLPALLASLLLAGCAATDVVPTSSLPSALDTPLPPVVTAAVDATMTFAEKVVGAAVTYNGDLYEPTMEACDDGTLYITGHTILVDTTGAPVFFSRDDGATWAQLPFLASATLPADLPGATPPPSDEIFLSCGDEGWVYGVDITLATYPVNGWSGSGASLDYHNPNAYNEAQNVVQAAECQPVPAKDRPWGAYENGTLLMVSNPAGGPTQLGVLQVPPITPVGVGIVPALQPWNMCAGPGGSIPGIPDIRADGLFAAPQQSGGALFVTLGNKADVMDVEIKKVFDLTSLGEITSRYGIAAFDAAGDLFIGITNNTARQELVNGTDILGRPTSSLVDVADQGQLRFATSTDGGATFLDRTYAIGKPVVHFYLDANENGAGALAVWAVEGDSESTYDYFVGHLFVGADGSPVLTNVALAIDDGPQPSAHVTGAAVGPDGRSYLAMFRSVEMLGTPLSVYVQTDGPTLPVNA